MVLPGFALVSGVIGGIAVSAILAMVRAAGLRADWELMLGAVALPFSGAAALVAGYVLHVGVAAALALVYARGFELAGGSSAQAGFLFGLVQAWMVATLGGLMFALGPIWNPDLVSEMTAYIGPLGVVAFLLAQVAYGTIVGALHAHSSMRSRV